MTVRYQNWRDDYESRLKSPDQAVEIIKEGDLVEIGSRNEKPMTRYFPEVVEAALANLPERCVVDGEIIVADGRHVRIDVAAELASVIGELMGQ